MGKIIRSILIATIILSLLVSGISCSTPSTKTLIAPTNEVDYTSPLITGEDWNNMTLPQRQAWVDLALDAMMKGGELQEGERRPADYYVQELDKVFSTPGSSKELVAWELTSFTESTIEIPAGFIKLRGGNFALGLTDLLIGHDPYLKEERIALTLTVIKLSHLGEGSHEELELVIDLIDDNGEIHTSHPNLHYGFYMGIFGDAVSLIPKGFTWCETVFFKTLPVQAYGHIRKILVNNQEITQTDFHLPKIEENESIIRFGEEITLSELVSVTPLRVSLRKGERSSFVDLQVKIHNRSYKSKIVDVAAGYQSLNGELGYTSWPIVYGSKGKWVYLDNIVLAPDSSSTVSLYTDLESDQVAPSVRAYLLYFLSRSDNRSPVYKIILPD